MKGALKLALSAAVAVLGLVAVYVAMRLWTEYEWYASMGRQAVLVTRYASAIGVWSAGALVAFALFATTSMFARRLLKQPPSTARLLTASAALAGLASLNLARNWMTFRLAVAQAPFGTTDPVFGRDIGFYVFTLPALELTSSWLSGLVLLAVILVVALALMPGRSSAGAGFEGDWWGLKTALSVLLGLLMLTVAFGMWVDVWRQVLPGGGHSGAFYTDIHARIPGGWLLAALTVALAIVFFATARSRGWRLPATAFVSWVFSAIVITSLWPATVQTLVVQPTEALREKPYIASNIRMTRDAFDLRDVKATVYAESETLPAGSEPDVATALRDARIWTPKAVRQAFDQLETVRPYYRLSPVSTDRYEVGGSLRQVLVSAREIDTRGLPRRARTWVNEHLVYTHGYGLAVSSASGATGRGFPEFLVSDVPPRRSGDATSSTALEAAEPRIYYGPDMKDYALVRTGIDEFDYPTPEGNAGYRYEGERGIAVGSTAERLAWSARLGSPELLLSDYLDGDSLLLLHRDIKERVALIAPWLELDEDPYPAIVDGRILWILDATTSSDHYPYSQPLSNGTNYRRDSVKVVVDAYSGETTFYAIGDDPIRDAWGAIFPGLITPSSSASQSLVRHFRYPKPAFDAQASIYKTYHMTEPSAFYNKEDQWQFAKTGSGRKVPAEYLTLDIDDAHPGRGMYLIQPFAPANRDNLVGWLATGCDPDDYGDQTVVLLPKDRVVLGPAQVLARIEQDPVISPQLTLWDQRGSSVVMGQMTILPVEGTVAYIQPIFIQAKHSAITELAGVVVATGDRMEMGRTMAQALSRAFPHAGGGASPKDGGELDAALEAVAAARRSGDRDAYDRSLQQLRDVLDRLLGAPAYEQ